MSCYLSLPTVPDTRHRIYVNVASVLCEHPHYAFRVRISIARHTAVFQHKEDVSVSCLYFASCCPQCAHGRAVAVGRRVYERAYICMVYLFALLPFMQERTECYPVALYWREQCQQCGKFSFVAVMVLAITVSLRGAPSEVRAMSPSLPMV